jgi:hypothetical protein
MIDLAPEAWQFAKTYALVLAHTGQRARAIEALRKLERMLPARDDQDYVRTWIANLQRGAAIDPPPCKS